MGSSNGLPGAGRSPHGERGLKYNVAGDKSLIRVALLTESVD